MRETDGAQTTLRLVSSLCAAAYLASQAWQPYPGNWALKGSCVAILAVIAFRQGHPILATALALSSAGDILLDLNPERLFVFGLALFLFVHLLYIFVFMRNRRIPDALPWSRAAIVILVAGYSGSIGAWLLPDLGGLMLPVAIYICAITGMVVTAVLVRFDERPVVWGAVLFLISDSLLAIDKFKTPLAYRDYLVWATYYLGQYGIAAGLLQQERGGPE